MEIEIKAKVKDFQGIKKQLGKIKAKYIGRRSQVDYYYSLYKRPLAKKKGNVLRVRYDRITGQTRLEFHKPKNIYVAEEIELQVDSLRAIKRILREMGARQECVVDKERLVYKKGKVEIVLDKVKSLGNFVEVEIIGNETKNNLALLYNILGKLGIKESQMVMHGRYHSMVLKKKGNKYAYF